MTRSVSVIVLVLVAALLINALSYCSAESVYCVTPTATSCSSCPHNSNHCATLSEYAQEAETYFTSNTTMVFLPGDHILDRNITVGNVARLTMHGDSSSDNIATIVRNGSVGFSFTNMVDFSTYSLAFTSYNRSWSYGSHSASSFALLLQSTQNAKLVNCSFHDNLGTALAVNNTNITLAGNSNFTNNSALNGGAIHAENNSLLCFNGTSNFRYNSAEFDGGAIYTDGSAVLTFNGTNNFTSNSAQNGGAIHAETNSSLMFIGTSNFSHNSATNGDGGAIETDGNAVLTFIGITNFTSNSAQNGGAIHAETNSSLTFIGTSNFSHNSATNGDGGAIETDGNAVLTFNGITNFTSNSAQHSNSVKYGSGGAIHAEMSSSLTFNGTSIFSHNSAHGHGGGAIFRENNAILTFSGTSNFTNNSAQHAGGAIYAETDSSRSSTSHNSANKSDDGALAFTGSSSFINNSAMQGGAISANVNTKLTFDGNINFTNNGHMNDEMNVNKGGAIHLTFSSIFFLMPNTTVHLEKNHANLGGAIFVFDGNPLIYCSQFDTVLRREECFFQLPGQNLFSDLNIQLVFKNNSADEGSVLYGGAIDNCTLTGLDSYNSSEVFDMLFQYGHDNKTSSVSSDTFRVCLCENEEPNCDNLNKTLSVYPGETFSVSVVTTGQGNETVPALVRSRILIGNSRLASSQYIQKTNRTCTTLKYTVFSQMNMSQVQLYADGPCSTFGDILTLHLNISQTCPHGFDINDNQEECVCDRTLQNYTNNCNITNGLGQITRESDDIFWVGYNEQTDALTVHPHCPFDYCVDDTVVFSLDNTDMQCANNRSGLLCGACISTRYSLVLGTSRCKQCTNIYLLLLIAFALMGVALVFLLLVCKLTVAAGTLSGLVFYANIVGVNRTLFLPEESPALSVFIAWLNLDFGIETCFYDGMDAYSQTWLQFVFPVYIWVLVGLIILISHFSQRFAKLLGNNPVSILATLILLSYAKILRTFITAVSFTDLEYHNTSSTDLEYHNTSFTHLEYHNTSFTHLEYQEQHNTRVWLYDANIDYLEGKHIPLFLVAVAVFLFLFLPYTLLLLFGQWLQAISHLKVFSWVNSTRLKAFMDSYHAPYKTKHRYWPGLLLVLRFLLLLEFALNYQRDLSINLLAILVGTGILQLWAWVSGGVYKNWCLDALEGSFILNLIILVGATYYVSQSGGSQLAVGYTSVSIAAITFIGILAYHIFQQVRHAKLWKKASKLNLELRKLNKKLNTKQEEYNQNFDEDTIESGRFDRLRESLLDDLPQPTHSVV